MSQPHTTDRPARLRRGAMLSKLLLIPAMLVLPLLARAEPPAGSNPNSPEAGWYRSLAQPKTGYGCCSIADCRPVAFRADNGHYTAFIDRQKFPGGDDAWHDVPDAVVIRDRPNPTGEAVACWYARQVRCFVLPSLT